MGERLTVAQRAVRPVINLLVEWFFPHGLFFYGGGPLVAFDKADSEKSAPIGSMAAIFLARHANAIGAAQLSIEAKGVTINSEDIGDWTITVRRSGPAALAKEGEEV